MKKNQVKTARVAMLGCSAAMAMAGSIISVDAIAACTAGTTTAPVHCEIATTEGPFAEAFSFTGSNNVSIAIAGNATAFGVCGFHAQGKNSFGLSLNGGSMKVTSGQISTATTGAGC